MIEGDKKNERKKDIYTKCDEGENMPSVPSAGKIDQLPCWEKYIGLSG